jgi:hypothetical protein
MSDFPPQLPHGKLDEVLDDVFFVMGQSRPKFGGKQLQFSRSMTVVRDGDELTLVNSLRLDDEGLAMLDELGKVTSVVKLGSFHGRDDAFYIDRYGATLWTFPAMPHERGVTTAAELVPGKPGPCAGSSAFVFETSDMPEGLLVLERHGGIVMSCDSLQNWSEPDEHFDEASTGLMEEQGFFRTANVGPGWRNGAKPEASDFERIKALSFSHLFSAHGAPLLDEAHAALCATFADLYDI